MRRERGSLGFSETAKAPCHGGLEAQWEANLPNLPNIPGTRKRGKFTGNDG